MREVVDTERGFEQAVFDYETAGWDVEEKNQGRAVLNRGYRGGWGWHLLFLVLIPIGGNLAYSAYRRFDRPERAVIRLKGTTDTEDTDRAAASGDPGEE